MEKDFAAIASRAGRHASERRYRAEDLIYEAWQAAGPRRAVLARKALAPAAIAVDRLRRLKPSQTSRRQPYV
jgi:hypothetical protein